MARSWMTLRASKVELMGDASIRQQIDRSVQHCDYKLKRYKAIREQFHDCVKYLSLRRWWVTNFHEWFNPNTNRKHFNYVNSFFFSKENIKSLLKVPFSNIRNQKSSDKIWWDNLAFSLRKKYFGLQLCCYLQKPNAMEYHLAIITLSASQLAHPAHKVPHNTWHSSQMGQLQTN